MYVVESNGVAFRFSLCCADVCAPHERVSCHVDLSKCIKHIWLLTRTDALQESSANCRSLMIHANLSATSFQDINCERCFLLRKRFKNFLCVCLCVLRLYQKCHTCLRVSKLDTRSAHTQYTCNEMNEI